jgi:hypothetical protein
MPAEIVDSEFGRRGDYTARLSRHGCIAAAAAAKHAEFETGRVKELARD